MQKYSLLLLSLLLISCGASSPKRSVVGHWEGTIPIEGNPLRVFIHVQPDSTGKLTGTMDSPDQLSMQIPLTGVDTTGDSLDVNSFVIAARYIGMYRADRDEIEGQWMQGPSVYQMTLKRNDEIAFARPQEPKQPFPYREQEYSITLRDGGKLGGTLTIPQGNGPFPMAVLVTGSGSQDRDETIASHKPFFVLADHLTRNGIAVLRFDDRGVGASRSSNANVGADVIAQDVIEIIHDKTLDKSIDRTKIGLIGHSEGGSIVTLAANQAPDVKWLVLLASLGVPGDSILKLQYDRLVGDKLPPAMRNLQRQALALVKLTADSAQLYQSLNKLYSDAWDSIGTAGQQANPKREQFASASAKTFMSKPMLYLIRHDPRPQLSQLRIPVLALIGSNDQQVYPDVNLPALRDALKSDPNASVEEMPKLNHLFQTSKTGDIKEYGVIKETFAPAALERVSTWIKQVTK